MERLIFVYNADAGYFNLVADIAHKIFSPKTYPCSLCDLTYGVFKIRPEWEDFVQHAPAPLTFLHKDEFHTQFPAWRAMPLPVVLGEEEGHLQVVLDKASLDGFTSIGALKAAILEKLREKTR